VTTHGKTRVQIVENYRINNSVVQKVLRHVGTAKDMAELEDIKKMAEHIKETIEDELCPRLFSKEQRKRLHDTILTGLFFVFTFAASNFRQNEYESRRIFHEHSALQCSPSLLRSKLTITIINITREKWSSL